MYDTTSALIGLVAVGLPVLWIVLRTTPRRLRGGNPPRAHSGGQNLLVVILTILTVLVFLAAAGGGDVGTGGQRWQDAWSGR